MSYLKLRVRSREGHVMLRTENLSIREIEHCAEEAKYCRGPREIRPSVGIGKFAAIELT